MRILFITPYPPNEAPSQRFRFEQYLVALEKQGINYDLHSFITPKGWMTLYKPGGIIRKILEVFHGYANRCFLLFNIHQYNYIFIHREAAPFGPPIFEWIVAKVFRKKIIYDFDDAIWSTDKSNESRLEGLIRWRAKVGQICKWSYRISCGNKYLCDYAKRFNNNVVHNPTTIDTEKHKPVENIYPKSTVTIGWTGSHSTLKYLNKIEPILQALEKKYQFIKFLIIADQAPELKLSSLEFIKWSKENEIEDLVKIDIGIMPLPNDEWAKGKCGFKALQYMALGIPAVVSPVGVNVVIVSDKVDGFLCDNEFAWHEALESLILDKNLRKEMGNKGRKKIIEHYSFSSNKANFLSLFE